MRQLTAAIALAAGCGLSDKGRDCAETGCLETYPDKVVIALDPASDEWVAGAYTFAVGLNGEVVTCTVTVGQEDERTCSSELVALIGSTFGTGEDAVTSVIMLQVNTVPDSLDLQVSRDGEEIASETFTLAIDESDYPAPDPDNSCLETCPDELHLEFALAGRG